MKGKFWFGLISAAFALPLFAFGLWSLLGEKPDRSDSENRVLQPMPSFSMGAYFEGGFTSDFDKHYNDTFPLREHMLGINREMNRFYYFSPFASGDENGNVVLMIPSAGNYIAEGGEAFSPQESTTPPLPIYSPTPSAIPTAAPMPIADDGDVWMDHPDDIEPEPEPEPPEPPLPELTDADADLRVGSIIIVGDRAMEVFTNNADASSRYAEAINRYSTAMPETRVISLVTPNGGAFYAPVEFRTGDYDQQAMINGMYEQLGEGVVPVDVYSMMRAHVDEYLFFRSDHHWTQLGAYYAYAAFCDALGYDAVHLDEFETGEIPNYLGSMYSMVSGYPQSSAIRLNPDTVQWWRPLVECRALVYGGSRIAGGGYEVPLVAGSTSAANKYLIFISGDNPLLHITTDAGNSRKIAVIKESYGNAFVPFLVNHYEDVFVIDPRRFNGADKPSFDLAAFVAEHEIDDVLVINYPLVIADNGYISNIINPMIKQ